MQGTWLPAWTMRGTPAPQGRAWRKSVYGQIGVLSSAQQAEAVQVLEQTRSYIDPKRIAIWGWSGGGSSTLQAMFRYPDVYQVGMAWRRCPMNASMTRSTRSATWACPIRTRRATRRPPPINQAEGLKGHLLMVHGSGDDNVHFQGAQLMLNRLIELGKQFDFMEYPNRSHCICEGDGTTLHIYSLLTRYLMEHLPAGPQ